MMNGKEYFKRIILTVAIVFSVLAIVFSGCRVSAEKVENANKGEITQSTEVEDTAEEDSNDIPGESVGTGPTLMDEDIKEYIATLDLDAHPFIKLSQEDKEYLIQLAYDTVSGYVAGEDTVSEGSYPDKYDSIENDVHIILRVDGDQKGWNFASGSNLAETVVKAVINTLENNNTDISSIGDNLWKLGIEIIIKGDEKPLDDGFERGIHGIVVRDGSRHAIALSTLSVEGNYSIDYILNSLYRELGLDADNRNADEYYFSTIHFAKTMYDDEVVTIYRCSRSELVPDVTAEKIFNTVELAEGWMLLNLDEDGCFNYGYSPSRKEYLTTNNMIRQFLSSRWLAEKSNSNPELLYLHKINLDYILNNWYMQEGDLGYIYFGEKSKLGAMAMAISTIARSPYYEEYEIYAERLASTVLSMQHEDGSFNAWFIEPDYAYDEDSLLRFYSGEGMLGMLELYEASGEERYLEAMKVSQDYYIEKYVENIDKNYSPAMVPWQTMSLSKLYKITGDRKYIDAIFILNDRLLSMQDQTGETYPDFLGRFYDPEHPEYGPPNSGSTSPYVEGLAYAYEIAKMEGDQERMAAYKKAIVLGIHSLMNCQFKGSDMYYLENPERVEGALRYRMYDNRIRIDTTQHTIDALLKVIEVFELNPDMG